MKNLSKLLVIVVIYFSFFIYPTFAQNSSNDNYTIEIKDIDTPEDSEIITPRKMQTVSVKKVEQNTITTGIESIVQTAPLTFSLSANIIDFGILNPGNPVVRTLDLTVLSNSLNYQVIGFENRPLTGTSIKDMLPDTTCDGGNCDETTDAEWKNNLTYGFGYRCENITYLLCHSFPDDSYFKQFADLNNKETAQTILNGQKQKEIQEARIIFKVNSSGAQKSESYTNTVTFIAVPNF